MPRPADEAPRAVDVPEPGLFLMRLVKGGPLVAAQILQHTDGKWMAEIDGHACGPSAADPVYAEGVFRIWHSAERTTQAEYDHHLRVAAWARKHAPDDPAANPGRAINLATMKPVF